MKKIFVRDIFCNHFAPKTKEEFIYTHFTRGVISAGYAKNLLIKVYFLVFLGLQSNFYWFYMNFLCLLKVIRKSLGMIKFTDKKSRFFVFYFLYFLKSICFVFGEFNTFLKYMFGKYT